MWAGEMWAQRAKELIARPDNLSSIPRIPMVGRENQLPKAVLHLDTSPTAHCAIHDKQMSKER